MLLKVEVGSELEEKESSQGELAGLLLANVSVRVKEGRSSVGKLDGAMEGFRGTMGGAMNTSSSSGSEENVFS